MVKLNHKKILILIFVLILIFIKTLSYNNTRFPYHHDEWQHIALAQQIINGEYNKINPYTGEDLHNFHLEPGFHFFIAFLIKLGINIILFYKYLPALFSVFTAITIFICIFKLTKKFDISIVSILIYAFIKSNINILGKDFFIPLTLAIPFMFLFITYFILGISKNNAKKIIFSYLIIIIILLIHPPSCLILLITAFIYLGMKKEINHLIFLITSILIIIFISIAIFWNDTLIETILFFKNLIVFNPGWGQVEVTYSIPLFYGIVNTFLAIFGFFNLNKLKFFKIFAFTSIIFTAFYNIFTFSIIIPYQRAVHYTVLALIPLSAYGFIKGTELIKMKFKFKQTYVLYFLLIFTLIYNRYEIDSKFKHYNIPVISEEDYKILIKLKNYGINNTIIAPFFMTSSLTPITGQKTISIIPAQISGGWIKENQDFYDYDCIDKKTIIDYTGADYIYSRQIISCDYLNKIYSENGINVYRT